MTEIRRVEIILTDGTVLMAYGEELTACAFESGETAGGWTRAKCMVSGEFQFFSHLAVENPEGFNRDVSNLLKQIKVSVKK